MGCTLLSLVCCTVWHCGKSLFAHKHTHTHSLYVAWQDAVGQSSRSGQRSPTGSSEYTEQVVGGLKVRSALDTLALLFLSHSLFFSPSLYDL